MSRAPANRRVAAHDHLHPLWSQRTSAANQPEPRPRHIAASVYGRPTILGPTTDMTTNGKPKKREPTADELLEQCLGIVGQHKDHPIYALDDRMKNGDWPTEWALAPWVSRKITQIDSAWRKHVKQLEQQLEDAKR